MCGICGICFDDVEARVEPKLLESMTSSLKHRGPDGQGVYINGNIGLGHRRLSIIDLDKGGQPIFNEDKSIFIVFNGEIYNYKELRETLLLKGHTFRTNSDTEVIVHLYEDEGEKCLESLNGMFSFAIWNSRQSLLFAARDRFGEKPFYYHQSKSCFIFASELKTILKDSSVSKEIDIQALDNYLAFGYVPAPRTIFKGIHKLRAAHSLTWTYGRQVTTKRYWKAGYPATTGKSDSDYVEELQMLLEDSIRLRMRSDVPVGAFLSGGLDSNGIVALASRHVNTPLKTFSVGFSESEFNELSNARLTARRYGTDHHEIIVSDSNVSMFGELVEHFDEPFADPSMLPTYLISREAARFVKVCISGDAGDEVFGGYTRYLSALQYEKIDRLPLFIRKLILGSIATIMPDFFVGKGFLQRLSVSPMERYQSMVGIFNEVERKKLFLPDISELVHKDSSLFEEYFNQTKTDLLSTLQLVDQNTYLPEDILVKVDRASMKSSLEVRVPFLDHRLVEFVNSMPSNMKIRGKNQKYILRTLLKNIVPQEVLTAPKKGFGIPIKNWFRGELQSFARELLLSPSSRTRDFFDSSSLERLLKDHERGGRDLSNRIWALLAFEQWSRQY